MPRLAFGPVSAPNMPILASHFALLLPPLEAVPPPLVPHGGQGECSDHDRRAVLDDENARIPPDATDGAAHVDAGLPPSGGSVGTLDREA